MHRCGWLIVALLLVIAVGATAKERVWTSSDGRTMRGEFVRELDGEVTFLVGGKLQTVPLDRLSERDQQIVRDLAAGKEVPDDPMPVESPAPAAGDPFAPSADDPFASPPAGKNPPASATRRPADVEPAGDAPSLTKNRPKAPVSRVWTDNQGRLTTGKFVRIFNGNVVLTRAGGPVTIPFFDLTEADQQYVKDFLTSRGEEALIPVRPAAAVASDLGGGTPPREPRPLPGAGPGVGPSETTPMPMPGYVPAGSSSGGYNPSPYDGQSRLDDPLSQASANAAAQSAGGTTPQYENTTGRVPMCSACKS